MSIFNCVICFFQFTKTIFVYEPVYKSCFLIGSFEMEPNYQPINCQTIRTGSCWDTIISLNNYAFSTDIYSQTNKTNTQYICKINISYRDKLGPIQNHRITVKINNESISNLFSSHTNFYEEIQVYTTVGMGHIMFETITLRQRQYLKCKAIQQQKYCRQQLQTQCRLQSVCVPTDGLHCNKCSKQCYNLQQIIFQECFSILTLKNRMQ